VAGIVAAIELNDVVDALSDEVGSFTFTLIAPLGSDNDNGGHQDSFVKPPLPT
jgi:hypothetical protein